MRDNERRKLYKDWLRNCVKDDIGFNAFGTQYNMSNPPKESEPRMREGLLAGYKLGQYQRRRREAR